MEGVVIKWFTDRRYGFIAPDDLPANEDKEKGVYVHFTNVEQGKSLSVGARVEFNTGPVPKVAFRHVTLR